MQSNKNRLPTQALSQGNSRGSDEPPAGQSWKNNNNNNMQMIHENVKGKYKLILGAHCSGAKPHIYIKDLNRAENVLKRLIYSNRAVTNTLIEQSLKYLQNC